MASIRGKWQRYENYEGSTRTSHRFLLKFRAEKKKILTEEGRAGKVIRALSRGFVITGLVLLIFDWLGKHRPCANTDDHDT